MKKFHAVLLAPIILTACSTTKTLYTPSDKKIQYAGRVGKSDTGVTAIYWPGSSIKTSFNGTGLKATLKDQRGHNHFNVIIDKDSVYPLRIDSAKNTYVLAANLPPGDHTVELYRRSDWNDGITWFYGFEYDKGTKVHYPATKKRMIEFYGNSITVGSAIEDTKGDSGDGLHTNNYLSYGALTARHYDAKYSCIARSGIGLMVSWFSLIMPEMYNRLNPFDPKSVWDFSSEQPDIVVINLLQNDNALVGMPDYDQFKNRFGDKAPTEAFIIDAYSAFVARLRGHYPKANIICVLGSMDAVKPGSPWPGYIDKAVQTLHDPKMYTHFFEYINNDMHPKVEDHKKMAATLIDFIDKHIKW